MFPKQDQSANQAPDKDIQEEINLEEGSRSYIGNESLLKDPGDLPMNRISNEGMAENLNRTSGAAGRKSSLKSLIKEKSGNNSSLDVSLDDSGEKSGNNSSLDVSLDDSKEKSSTIKQTTVKKKYL